MAFGSHFEYNKVLLAYCRNETVHDFFFFLFLKKYFDSQFTYIIKTELKSENFIQPT